MNRTELIDAISEKANVTKKQADAVLSAGLETIIDAVSSGDKVTLVGFGVFGPRDRAAREGRNPSNGEKLEIPATRVPGFTAGKMFKDAVRVARSLEATSRACGQPDSPGDSREAEAA